MTVKTRGWGAYQQRKPSGAVDALYKKLVFVPRRSHEVRRKQWVAVITEKEVSNDKCDYEAKEGTYCTYLNSIHVDLTHTMKGLDDIKKG